MKLRNISYLSFTLLAVLALQQEVLLAKRKTGQDVVAGIHKPKSAAARSRGIQSLTALSSQLSHFEADAQVSREIRSLQKQLHNLAHSMNEQGVQDALSATSKLSKQVDQKASAINSEFAQLLSKINTALSGTRNQLQQQQTCNEPQVISEAGVVLDTPGLYCVANDLTFGAGETAAITVAANGVTIDFGGHTLTLTNDTSTGIFALNVTHLSIRNGIIVNDPANVDGEAAAIQFDGIQQGYVNNVTLRNNFYGILTDNSRDIRLTRLFIDNSFGSNIRVNTNNTGIIIENSTFRNDLDSQLAVAGITVGAQLAGNQNRNIRIENSELFNSDIFFAGGLSTGISISNITSIIDDPDYTFGNLQFGSAASDVTISRATDIILTNSSFTNTNNPNPQASGITFVDTANILAENLVVANASPGDGSPLSTPTDFGTALTIGGDNVQDGVVFQTPVHNVLIRNSLITGGSRVGIVITGPIDNPTTGITIENTSISDAVEALMVIRNPRGVVLKNDKFLNSQGSGLIVINGVVGLALVDNVFLNIAGATFLAAPGSIFTASGNVTNSNAQVCFEQAITA